MSAAQQCPECGTTLAADAPSGLCPQCLVRQGLEILAPSASAVTGETKVLPPNAAPAGPPAPGSRQRFGDYELLQEIAHGGMGVVYRARQISLDRTVALKMILSGQLATPAEVQRFRIEAEAAAKLDHPNIVPIYEIGEYEGQHYFSMKLVEGGRLSDEIGGKPMPDRRAAQLMVSVARAVHFAHQHGVLHRDLKPTNVLLDKHGEPQLTDFGLAKMAEHGSTVTQTMTVIGTANYMAPEQASGQTRQLTTAVDVYSLGATLYEMLTGRPPFQGPNMVETLRQVVEKEPVRPRTLNPRLDRDLETICLKCLEKRPQHRYESAEALALDLERWLVGEPIHARPATTWERTIKWAKRKPAIATLLGLLVLVGAAGVCGIFMQWREAAGARRQAEEKAKEESVQREIAQATARELHRSLYEADVSLAQKALNENHLGRAVELLHKYSPLPGEADLRGFEWRYLWKLTRGDELFTFPHDHYLEAVAFSPDGKWLATISRERLVRIWDVAARCLVARLSGLDTLVDRGATLLFSPDGRFLVATTGSVEFKDTLTGSFESLWVWETENWNQPPRKLAGIKLPVFFLPGGQTMVSRTFGGVLLWDTSTWQQTELSNEFFPGLGRLGAVSSDGKVIAATVGENEIQVWDVASQTKLNQFAWKLERITDLPKAMAVSADANFFALSDWKGRIKIWEVHSGREFASWPAHTSPIYGLCFSPDSRMLATAGFDQVVHLWDVKTQTRLNTFRGHSNELWSVSFSPDGALLASGGKDCTAKLWNATARPEENALTDALVPLAFVAKGTQLLAATAEGGLGLWDVATRAEVQPIPVLDPAPLVDRATQIETLQRASDRDEYVAMPLGREGGLEVWSSRDPHGTKFIVGQQAALSPDKQVLAKANGRSVSLVDLKTGAELGALAGGGSPVAFSPDGKRLVGCNNKDFTAKLWTVASRAEIATLQGHKWTIWAAGFSPDSKLLVTASIDATARVWDAETGELVAVLTGHKEGVSCLSFSPDGKTLATGSTDDTVKLWSLATFQELLTLNFGEDVGSVIFSPDGQTLAVGVMQMRGGRVKPVELWRAPSLAEIEAHEKARRIAP